jgi:serine-type D-Ala-D-Ala carboxypeptidase/endopeptidase (penicillin-binding protein 4)
MRNLRCYIFLVFIISACSPFSAKRLSKTFMQQEQRLKNHIGFQIYDVQKQKNIFEYQSDRYFTPASNTKVLTLFACLSLLGDSIPAIRYVERNDSLIFWGLGDPSFLNQECYNNFRLFNFLNNATSNLYFSPANFATTHFGKGWAWDDYKDYYSTERSSFSIYGNTFSFYPFPDRTVITPKYFEKYYTKGETRPDPEIVREINSNWFTYHPGLKKKFKEFTTPIHLETPVIRDLLQDTLHRKITIINRPVDRRARFLYTTPLDSLYKVMMQESDNHIAEQLLINCAAVISDSLKPEIAIRYVQEKYFNQLQDKPVWIDGSGLSRYNLFTPRFMVDVWKEIFRIVSKDRLFLLLAAGGKPGTLKNWFKAEKPYIFGKTGTVSNNHCLSGFLVTKKGKILIFSFMNANYAVPLNDVKTEMQSTLNLFYENY